MIKAIFWLAVASFITWMLWPQHNGPYGLPRGEVVTNNVWYCTPSTNRFVDVFVGDGTKGKVIIRYGVREIVGYIPEERCFANKEELVKAI